MQRVVIVLMVAIAAIGGLFLMLRSTDAPQAEEWDEYAEAEDPAASEPPSDSPAEARRSGDGNLARRVAQLEREVGMLKRQLGMRSVASARVGADSPADWEEAAEEPEFAEGVRAVLEEEKEKEQERWIDARRQGWEDMTTEILDELVNDAGISTEHREALYEAWSAEADQILPLVMQARSGEISWRDIRDQVQEIRAETDATAKDLLTEEQYAAYEEARPRPGPGGRRGGPGGRRGPPPGGPPPG